MATFPNETYCPSCFEDQGTSMDFSELGRELTCKKCGKGFTVIGEDTDEGFSFWTEPVE